ncbi:MAG: flagellar biosynthetic protein FliR [Oscillospiraceae bacterium]|nr:flagellar biosynthetic protein FliR [Oscillospiraceae bacterium]
MESFQDVWDLILYNFVAGLIIFARVTGIFIFNPILGRSTVPAVVRVAMSIVLTFVMLGAMGGDTVGFIPESMLHFGIVLSLEALIGFFFGFFVNMILNVIILAGKLMDFQISLAMAEMFDPSTGVTMPIMANLYYYMFVVYFFLAGGHLSYINLFYHSYQIIPIGFELTEDWHAMAFHIVWYFSEIFILAVRMAMPLIVSQTVLQIAVGVIMKAVPKIQIFVINIQMRVLFGFFTIAMITPVVSDFVANLMSIMFEDLFEVLYALGGGGG